MSLLGPEWDRSLSLSSPAYCWLHISLLVRPRQVCPFQPWWSVKWAHYLNWLKQSLIPRGEGGLWAPQTAPSPSDSQNHGTWAGSWHHPTWGLCSRMGGWCEGPWALYPDPQGSGTHSTRQSPPTPCFSGGRSAVSPLGPRPPSAPLPTLCGFHEAQAAGGYPGLPYRRGDVGVSR